MKVNQREMDGNTPFMAACANGYLDIVQFFVTEAKAKTTIKNSEGQTALHRACYYGQIKVIKYLLEKTRLSLFQKDKKGNTCLHLAAMKVNISCIRYIIKKLDSKWVKYLDQKNQQEQTPLDILVKIFNTIRDRSKPPVSENEVIDYILDKDKIPDLFADLNEMILQASPEDKKKPMTNLDATKVQSKHNLELISNTVNKNVNTVFVDDESP